MPLETLPIHPEVDYPAWWLWLAIGLAVLALAVLGLGIWRWWALRPAPEQTDDSLARARSEALAEIEQASLKADPRDACQQISRATRRFVGLASDGDADYMSARRLRRAARLDPRLKAVSEFVTATQDACYSPTALPDVQSVADDARKVVETWR